MARPPTPSKCCAPSLGASDADRPRGPHGIDAAGDTLHLALTNMRRRIETDAATAAHTDGYRTAFYDIVLPTLIDSFFTVGIAL